MILAPLRRLVDALPLMMVGWTFSIFITEDDLVIDCF